MTSTQPTATIEATIKGDNYMNINHQSTTKERKMNVSASNLIRWSGLSAMVAGIIFAGIQPIHPPDVLASVTTSAFIISQNPQKRSRRTEPS